MDAYLTHHHELLKYVQQLLVALIQELPEPHEHELFVQRFGELVDEFAQRHDERYDGQELFGQIFQRYPQLAPQIPRDLLWFFGGECLHFMPDEEIEQFQQLEERRHQALEQGDQFDWNHEVQLQFLPQTANPH